ncbi:hypothetical protein ACFXKX_38630 [Streptomyces scopuliridis]|uniref:hypothetical protein n=1 Tax=Streptomyces scopuliridis TaxID=452529 RepID=UPI0036C95FF3
MREEGSYELPNHPRSFGTAGGQQVLVVSEGAGQATAQARRRRSARETAAAASAWRTARNTAMLEAVTDLPPIVISDLFGVSATSAHRWARFAQDSWADHLAACQETE